MPAGVTLPQTRPLPQGSGIAPPAQQFASYRQGMPQGQGQFGRLPHWQNNQRPQSHFVQETADLEGHPGAYVTEPGESYFGQAFDNWQEPDEMKVDEADGQYEYIEPGPPDEIPGPEITVPNHYVDVFHAEPAPLSRRFHCRICGA